jgi:hypothetical protein
MRTVRFDPDGLTDKHAAWWDEWRKGATDAREAVLKSWEEWLALKTRPRPPFKPALKQKIWSELKKWLGEHVFHDRCAYCEGPREFDRYRGDAEHYRPKGAVTWRDEGTGEKCSARCTLPDGEEIDHPGYFWLAYDWRNLVPACPACNSGKGKVDQFPVKLGHLLQLEAAAIAGEPKGLLPELEIPKGCSRYFLDTATLDAREQPLLLNPLNPSGNGDPGQHLRYGIGGCVVALDDSAMGKCSIKVYRLDRGNLRKRRQKAQEDARREYYSILMQKPRPSRDAELKEMLDRYRTGDEDFSSAVLHHLRDEQAAQQRSPVVV